MAEAGVPLGNVGHLVQTPRAAMERIVAARPDIMTVYSVEKAAEIGAAAKSQGFEQPIMLRVIGEGDMLYPGQYGGFPLVELGATVDAIEALPGVRIAGVCSFPCLLFSEEAGRAVPTLNARIPCAARRPRWRLAAITTCSSTCHLPVAPTRLASWPSWVAPTRSRATDSRAPRRGTPARPAQTPRKAWPMPT